MNGKKRMKGLMPARAARVQPQKVSRRRRAHAKAVAAAQEKARLARHEKRFGEAGLLRRVRLRLARAIVRREIGGRRPASGDYGIEPAARVTEAEARDLAKWALRRVGLLEEAK